MPLRIWHDLTSSCGFSTVSPFHRLEGLAVAALCACLVLPILAFPGVLIGVVLGRGDVVGWAVVVQISGFVGLFVVARMLPVLLTDPLVLEIEQDRVHWGRREWSLVELPVVREGAVLQLPGARVRFPTDVDAEAAATVILGHVRPAGAPPRSILGLLAQPSEGVVRNPLLEATIFANPDDRGAVEVYVDWLLEQSSALGPVLAAALRGEEVTDSGELSGP